MTAVRPVPRALRRGQTIPAALPCLLVGLTLFAATLLRGQEPSPEEPNDKAAKYHEALVRRPSGGHLFERFQHAWLDTGSVAGLESFLVRRTEAEDAAPGETLLLAFFFSKQGKDGKAVEIFGKALAADPDNGEAWLEKAKAEARLLNFETALADLEKASATSPKGETAVETGKLKGRILARTGRGEEALAAWRELATGHADDEDLLEDLVDLHLAEGLVDEAVSLMQGLIEKSGDAYLKITRQLRLGDIHQRSGKREEAVALYDQSLGASGRDTWLEKEVLAQIEQVFRREDDLAGLEKHLAALIENDSGRIALRKRRALVLAELQQSDEASAAFAEILKLTPGDRGNREAYVDLLSRLGKHAEAAGQMAALAALHPEDAELSAQFAVRHHAAKQAAEAKTAVADYLAKSDGSEYAHLRAARLLEQFDEDEAAGEAYARLLSAFPDSLAAKEAQAEFLHRTGKKEEAVAAWKGIAASGTEQDALRAARALSGRGEREAAYAILLERAEGLADDVLFLGQLCGEAAALGKHEEALPWAEKRLALAKSPAELGDAMRQLLSFLDTLDRTAAYSETLAAKGGRSLAETCLLAELLERDGRHDEAEKTLRPALESGEPLAVTQQVRLFRARDEWARAAETQQRLVDLPDGRTASNVQDLVQLHRRAAAYDEALRWIEEWKKLSPGATQPWVEQSSVFREMDKVPEAIATLRLATQRFADQTELRVQLAGLHAQEGQFDDAERLYWTLYEESEDISQKVQWAGRLAGIASAAGRIEPLLEQFEERRRGNRTSLAPLLAIAEIHRYGNDYEKRREALLEATRLRPEDLKLLHEIARIEEEEGDWTSALETLRTATTLDPTRSTQERIALMQMRYGDEEEGFRQILELRGGGEMDVASVLSLADAMIARLDWERADAFLETQRTRFPDDYRLRYLQALVRLEDGRTEEAQALFLDLLAWPTEIAQTAPAAATTAVPTRAAATQIEPFPEGVTDLMGHAQYSHALAYRQMLRQGNARFNRHSGYGAMPGAPSGLIRLPSTLNEMHGFARYHLVTLATGYDDAARDTLAAAMESRGTKSAGLILRLPYQDPYSGQTAAEFPIELLGEHPDRLDLLAFGLVSQRALVYSSPASISSELMQRCYERFRADYQNLAFIAAVYAAASGSEEGAALLRRALEELTVTEEPTPMMETTILATLPISRPFGGRPQTLLPEEFHRPLAERIFAWEKAAKEKLTKASAPTFLLSQDYTPWLLRSYAPLDAFVDHLDTSIAQHGAQGGKQASQATALSQQLSWIRRTRAFLQKPAFPPLDLPDFPAEVLLHFATLPEQGYQPAPLDPAALGAQIDRVRSSVLRILLSHAAGDESRMEQEIEALLAATPESSSPVQSRWLAAAFFGSVKGDAARAVALLEELRPQPLDKETRRHLDAAIVAYAKEASPPAEEGSPLLASARAAALRLRYGTVSQQERHALGEALTTLGLETEAQRLQESAAVPRMASGFMRTPVQAPVKGLEERIKELTGKGQFDEAAKQGAQAIRPTLRQIASGNAGNQVDYDFLNFMASLSRQESVLAAVKKQLDPGDPAAAKPEALFEWGAFLESVHEFEPALTAYRTGLRALGGRKRPGIEARVAAILCFLYPKNAATMLADFDPPKMQRLMESLRWVEQSLEYGRGSNDRQSALDRNLNLARTFIFWIEAADERTLTSTDLSWIDYGVREKVAQQVFDGPARYLPGLYADWNPSSGWSRTKDQRIAAAAEEARRRQVHDDLCRAMMRSPRLARRAFSHYAGLRLAEDSDEAAADAELERLAKLSLETSAKPLRDGGNPGGRYYHNYHQVHITLWPPEEFLVWLALRRGERSAEEAIAAAKATKDREVAKAAEQLHDLAFCDAAEFRAKAKAYLSTTTSGHSFRGGGQPNALAEGLSAPAKLFAVWQLRRAELAGFDMAAFSMETAKTATGPEVLLPALLIEATARETGGEAATALLEPLALALLGKREQWNQFRKETPLGANSGSGRSGEFTQPRHVFFASLMQRLCQQPGTALSVTAWLRDNGLDVNEQVTANTLVTSLSSNQFTEEPEDALALLGHSPFLGTAETFRTLSGGRGKGLRGWLDAVKKQPDVRDRVREAAGAKGTFGGDLVVAYLSDDPTAKCAAVLGSHRAALENPAAAKTLEDLAEFVSAVYGDGGADYGAVGTDARAVLEKLGTRRMKTAREAADEFLAMKDFAGLQIHTDRELEQHLSKLLAPLWSIREWDLGISVYWHGIDLARKRIRAGEWRGYTTSGWNLEGDVLHDLFNEAPGNDLERIALCVRIVASDREGRLQPLFGAMGFAEDLRKAFDRLGGGSDPEAALGSVLAELRALCGEECDIDLSHYLADMVFNLRPALVLRLIAWTDAHAQGEDWSKLAGELGHALRKKMQTRHTPAHQALWPQVAELDRWQDHYLRLIQDDSRPLPWRLTLADTFCTLQASPRPEATMACADLLAQCLADDSPINTWHCQRICKHFNKLERSPEWEALARRLHDGWMHKNRNNGKDSTSGLAFVPGNECVLAMLETHLLLGDADLTRRMRTEKNAFNQVKADARTLHLLVNHGDFEGAAHTLGEGWEFQDITDDYIVAATYYQAQYSQRLHDRLPEFLGTIEDPALRYFAELLLIGPLDPSPREDGATYRARGIRLTEAAQRFASVDFSASPRGELLRTRVLQQIAAADSSAAIVLPVWEEEYRPEQCVVYCHLEDYKKIEHASRPLGAYAALRLRNGDTSVVEDMVRAANESKSDDYYRRRALEHFSVRLVESLKQRSHAGTPEEFAAYSLALGHLLAEPADAIVGHGQLAPLVGALFTASAMSGRGEELAEWAKSLPPKRAEALATAMRTKSVPFWTAFAQILKTKSPDPNVVPTAERREETLRVALACPLAERAFGSHEIFFKPMQDLALISVEELRGEPGERLATLFPRGGWAAAEIARHHADAGDWDAALSWSAKSTGVSDPVVSPTRYGRIAIRHAELLIEAKRNAEAADAIRELFSRVDLEKLPADVRQARTTVERKLGTTF